MTDQDLELDLAAANLMHDLRQFLHDARDQRDALEHVATAIAASAGLMHGHESGLQKIHRTLKRQIDHGVEVHIDGALNAHIRAVETGTRNLRELFDAAVAHWQRQKFEIAAWVLISSILGGTAGVLLTINLLGRI